MSTRLCQIVVLGLSLGVMSVWAGPADGAPAWTDEPPVLSRWIEQGYSAQHAGDMLGAAQNFCAAARYGSLEAQYRLGRLYLGRADDAGPAQGRAMLAWAAQRGHAGAADWISRMGNTPIDQEALPDCLLTGSAPQFEVHLKQAALEPPVPSEVVEDYILTLPQDRQRHARLIRYLAPRFDVDYRLALAIARAESNFDPQAVSPKNAQGLMQLIPATATRFGVRNVFDPEQNIRGGLAYLRWLLERFNGNVVLAAAAYNAGEGAVDRHGGVPPFPETRDYVQRILHFYRSPVHARPGAM